MLAPAPQVALHAYLTMLGGDGQGWLEVRYRTRRGMRTLFYPARGRSRQLATMIGRVSQHSDIFIGCAIRSEHGAGDKARGGLVYRVDWENDGTWDEKDSRWSTMTHEFQAPGRFQQRSQLGNEAGPVARMRMERRMT